MRQLRLTWIFTLLVAATGFAHAEDWKPAKAPLLTKWAKDVSPTNAHPEYPRPQMVRDNWQSLNGLWDYAVLSKVETQPEKYEGRILVPFAIESALSGVGKQVGPEKQLWYRRSFEASGNEAGKWLLHFGAVDWQTIVWVDGTKVGEHRGGYDPFTFDITSALKKDQKQHELIVQVYDPTDAGTQPRGKQIRNPHGIWYTPTTGIWQSVWLEPVPQQHIERLKIIPDIDAGEVHVSVETSGQHAREVQVEVVVLEGDKEIVKKNDSSGQPVRLAIDDAKLWSPDRPHLYDLKVRLVDGDKTLDEVTSYFGMRKIAIGKDEQGVVRLLLNNKPLFQYGLLDQGFFPDGLYTAPTEDALRYDIEVTKQLGFNMARKHVKVEPSRWYYLCDKLGLLVWQDMPSGDRYIGADDPDIKRTKESAEQFELELTSMMKSLQNHPSIVMWVPFNEGWGQYDTARIAGLVKELDPTRIVNSVSGWADRGVGEVHDIHKYPTPGMPPLEDDRAAVLGEFGGLGLPLKGHTWQDEANWGYKSYTSSEALTNAYLDLMTELHVLIGRGLAAAVYTQTTDVEIEVNGLLTYDRAVLKMDHDKVLEANKRLYGKPPKVTDILPTSQESGRKWRYTTDKPEKGWEAADFDDSKWESGRGGFGTEGTPGGVIRTEWSSPDIWIRQAFDLDDADAGNLQLIVHHDEDAKVYLNGTLVADLKGYTTGYGNVAIKAEHRDLLKKGKNVIAVHCHQTGGGQYIDVGLVRVVYENEKN